MPPAAIEAACRVGPLLGPYSDAPDDNETAVMLAAAWPHLYAAALRHAAETLFQPEPSVPAAILRQAALVVLRVVPLVIR